jgi:diguanylate cyclase (GGDEF)-like protein
MTRPAIQADVLARLLVVQYGLCTLPNEKSIAEFTCRALGTLPGAGSAWLCLDGQLHPPDPRFAEVCAQSRRHRDAPAKFDTDALEDRPGFHYFPVMTSTCLFGVLMLQAADEKALRPYLDFVANIANTIGLVLDSRRYQARLTDANRRLRTAHAELESLVAERTRELAHLSAHDPLTGLANRVLLADRLQQAIAHARRHGSLVAVVFLDLDTFTYVNASFGTSLGDLYLKKLALRLQALVNEDDTVARVGSDEFVLVLNERSGISEVAAGVARIMAAVRDPVRLDGREIVMTSSVGCSLFPTDAQEAESLLRQANAALYRAKEMGRDAVHFFSAGMDAAATQRMGLETDLRQALPRGELLLHYQPQVNLRSGRLVGMEALMRWKSPVDGLRVPSSFIPVAEDSNLIISLGEWALREACRQARAWSEAGYGGLMVAVNLSARQFRDPQLVEKVRRALADSGLEPCWLELEITESAIMGDMERVIGVMSDLKEMGVMLSVDDFGTGYSSLNYLRRFPVDKLKIDQSFVHDIETTESAAAVARAVILFGQSLRLDVIAEGVETEGQARFLHRHGCHEIQGYLVAPPQPPEEVARMLKRPPRFSWIGDVTA